MFGTVVVGIKADQDPGKLVETARSVTKTDGRIHLVTFVRVGSEGDERQRRARAKKRLEAVAEDLRAEGVEASSEVGMVGVAAGHEIARVATEQEADLLVIGLAKRSRVGKALLGSDAQSAILAADCAVLSLRLA